jgi:hypothetical protein
MTAEALQKTAPEKPRKGEQCNGCGFCCAAERCPLAIELIGPGPGPCPALEFDEDNSRFWCGIVKNASHYTDIIKPEYEAKFGFIIAGLYFGTGCDAEDFE